MLDRVRNLMCLIDLVMIPKLSKQVTVMFSR